MMRKFRKTLIASLGVYIFPVNLISLFFTNESNFIQVNLENSFSWNNITIVPIQLIQVPVCVVILSQQLAR